MYKSALGIFQFSVIPKAVVPASVRYVSRFKAYDAVPFAGSASRVVIPGLNTLMPTPVGQTSFLEGGGLNGTLRFVCGCSKIGLIAYLFLTQQPWV